MRKQQAACWAVACGGFAGGWWPCNRKSGRLTSETSASNSKGQKGPQDRRDPPLFLSLSLGSTCFFPCFLHPPLFLYIRLPSILVGPSHLAAIIICINIRSPSGPCRPNIPIIKNTSRESSFVIRMMFHAFIHMAPPPKDFIIRQSLLYQQQFSSRSALDYDVVTESSGHYLWFFHPEWIIVT